MNLKTVTLIAAVAAFAFLLIPVTSIINSSRLKHHGMIAEGTVIRVSSHKKGLPQVTVSFITAEGAKTEATASKSQHVSGGDRVRLWYDPAFPQKIDFGDTAGYNMRGVFLCSLLVVIFTFYFVKYVRRDLVKAKLMRSGKMIEAVIDAVCRNDKYRMGDNSPWIIKCRWTDSQTNKEYFFVSKDYTIDPRPYMDGIDHVHVYIDPSDPARYFMDTSFMPKGNITIG